MTYEICPDEADGRPCVQAVLTWRRRMLDLVNLCKVLPYPSELLEDGVFLCINTTETQGSCDIVRLVSAIGPQ